MYVWRLTRCAGHARARHASIERVVFNAGENKMGF
jgi:hypothetical protein